MRGDARTELAGAGADVEHAGLTWQPVEVEQRLLLRPDGFDLRGERANHGFVRHLLALRIEVHARCAHGDDLSTGALTGTTHKN